MSTRTWLGGSNAVAQVTAWVFGGTWEATDKIKITIGTHTVVVVAGSTVIATIVTTVAAALEAVTAAEFAEITWTANGTSLVATADTAGVPFSASVLTTETNDATADSQTMDGGTGASVGTDTTACAGPNFAGTAANWSGATLPVNGDTVIFADSDVDCLYGLTALAAVTTVTLKIYQSYTGQIGLPQMNGGDNGYREYRQRYLQFAGATLVWIGLGEGEGSQRIMLDFGSAAVSAIYVNNSGSPELPDEVAVFLKYTHSNTDPVVNKGRVGIAYYTDDAATVRALSVGYRDNQGSDAFVVCGPGTTGPSSVNQSGGYLRTETSISGTIKQTGGTHDRIGAGTTADLDHDGGEFLYRSSGTITDADIGSGANLDCRQDMRSKAITNIRLYEGCEYHDPFGVVTPTNGFDFVRCSPQSDNLVFDVAPNLTWTPSTI